MTGGWFYWHCFTHIIKICWFPKLRVPPVIIHFGKIFHHKPSTPMTMETQGTLVVVPSFTLKSSDVLLTTKTWLIGY